MFEMRKGSTQSARRSRRGRKGGDRTCGRQRLRAVSALPSRPSRDHRELCVPAFDRHQNQACKKDGPASGRQVRHGATPGVCFAPGSLTQAPTPIASRLRSLQTSRPLPCPGLARTAPPERRCNDPIRRPRLPPGKQGPRPFMTWRPRMPGLAPRSEGFDRFRRLADLPDPCTSWARSASCWRSQRLCGSAHAA